MHFLLFKVTIRSYEIVSKIEIDIHMVTFSLFSMHGHTVLKYVIIILPTMLDYDPSCK